MSSKPRASCRNTDTMRPCGVLSKRNPAFDQLQHREAREEAPSAKCRAREKSARRTAPPAADPKCGPATQISKPAFAVGSSHCRPARFWPRTASSMRGDCLPGFRIFQAGVQFSQRLQHETPLAISRMRHCPAPPSSPRHCRKAECRYRSCAGRSPPSACRPSAFSTRRIRCSNCNGNNSVSNSAT